jgi:uncharacterized membrane protein
MNAPALPFVWLATHDGANAERTLAAVETAIATDSTTLISADAKATALRLRGFFAGDVEQSGSEILLSPQAKLQCFGDGALLWLCSDSQGLFHYQAFISALEQAASSVGGRIWLVQIGIGAISVQPFNADLAEQTLNRAQVHQRASQSVARQRNQHAAVIVAICIVVSLAGLYFADKNPWQAFVIAVIYAPLLVAAVLTLVLIVQRVKAAFFSSTS